MEAAGLTLGAVAIVGLFTTCIEGFDIIVKAREFGEEFDLLCTQLSLQRVRLLLWGEALGLSSNSPLAYRARLEDENIASAIESTLNHLRSLLQKADLITDRYTVEAGCPVNLPVEPSKGLTIFRERFDSFKARLQRNQDNKSTWTVTKWAVHDLGRFRAVIGNIKDLIDGLEGITSAIGLLERQQALLAHEVESICDAQSLRLLRDLAISNERSPSLKLISDAASARLSVFADSLGPPSLLSKTVASNRSYRTALSHRLDDHCVPSMVEELSEDESSVHLEAPSLRSQDKKIWLERVERNMHGETRWTAQGVKSWAGVDNQVLAYKNHNGPSLSSSTHLDDALPQNQRLMAGLMSKSCHTLPQLSFESGSSTYGNNLAAARKQDTDSWAQRSTQFLVHSDKGVLSARRIFLELRSIKYANVPFISAAPLGDSLDKMIARIEGPPGTPYEGGIFWILVSFSSLSEKEPPSLRFLTRIYHPNIGCNGNICGGDYETWWKDLERIGTSPNPGNEPWFSTKRSNWYSLGALLTALCGLLASPNIEDPLVLEVAETYVRNYAEYYDAAKLYTRRYAREDMPPAEYADICDNDKWVSDTGEIANGGCQLPPPSPDPGIGNGEEGPSINSGLVEQSDENDPECFSMSKSEWAKDSVSNTTASTSVSPQWSQRSRTTTTATSASSDCNWITQGAFDTMDMAISEFGPYHVEQAKILPDTSQNGRPGVMASTNKKSRLARYFRSLNNKPRYSKLSEKDGR